MDNIFQNAVWVSCPAHQQNQNFVPIFRKTFTVSREIISGSLTVCGLGYHYVELNGKPVTDEVLVPAFTRFDKRIYYSQYQVTDLLLSGENVLSVELGRGFFSMKTPNVWNHEKSVWHSEPTLICCLRIKAPDGEEYVISDESFKTRPGATTRACLYTGETVDGRAAEKLLGWRNAGFNDSDWENAIVSRPPPGKLLPAYGPPIRTIGAFTPLDITRTSKETQLVKFPYNISGWCRISAKGIPGETLKIRYGEAITENKQVMLDQEFVDGDLQTDEYIFGESGVMDFEPKFSYKGFQYIELIGNIPDIAKPDITAKWVVSDVKRKTEFSCSNELINKFYDAVVRTIQNNLHAIPTDTPIYEKNGWIGDAGLIAQTATINFDIKMFFDKWLLDIKDCMREDGSIPLIVPTSSWGYEGSPEWIDSVYEIAWQLYITGNDQVILTNHYEMLKQIATYELNTLDENGLPDSVLGDWNPPGVNGACGPEGSKITATCFLIKSLRILSKIAGLIGQIHDANDYHLKAENLAQTLNSLYFDIQKGCYKAPCEEYRQIVDILTLYFDITPADWRKKRFSCLVDDIMLRDCHLNTGILGTKYLLPLLSEFGRHDLAWAIATKRTYPSWGYWIDNGATTFYEAWELDKRSHNHFMFGTILDWIVGYLAGFQYVHSQAGSIMISPMPVGDLKNCQFKAFTDMGKISIGWEIQGGAFTLEVDFPAEAGITICMPDKTIIKNAKPGQYSCYINSTAL